MNIKRSYYGFGVNITSFNFKEAEFLNQEKCNTKPQYLKTLQKLPLTSFIDIPKHDTPRSRQRLMTLLNLQNG